MNGAPLMHSDWRFWGSDEDLRNHAADLSDSGDDAAGNLGGASDVEAALAAFGLKEE